jgi:hypothetical protein
MITAIITALAVAGALGGGSAVPPAPGEAVDARPLPAAVRDTSARRTPGPALSFEVRGGIGTGEYHASSSAGERTAGASWRAQVAFAPVGLASIYIAYGQSNFGCRGGFCAQAPVDFTGRGIDAGVQLHWRALWLQAGALSHSLDAEWPAGDGAGTRQTGRTELGWLLGTGVEIPVAAGFAIAPGVRYMRHAAGFEPAPMENVVHFVGEVGLRYRVPLRR